MRGRNGGRCGHVHAFTNTGEPIRAVSHATDARAGVTVP
jgi:hypothetical protein